MRRLLLLIFAVPSIAFASDWKVINTREGDWMGYAPGQDTNGQVQHSTVSILVDRDSIVTNGQVKQVWWKETASKNGFVMDLISLTSFDCTTHMLRTERSGSRNRFSDPYQWGVVDGKAYGFAPDDPWDHVFGAVCLNKWNN